MDHRRQSYAAVVGGSPMSQPSGNRPLQLGSHSTSSNHPQTQDPRSRTPYRPQYDEPSKSSSNIWNKGGTLHNSWVQGGFSNAYTSQSSLMLLRPSYLQETSYMERLEAAHKAKLASQRDTFTPGQLGSGQTSLSTSSSSASLHRMAPSHRGMTYEIVEHHPPSEDEAVPALPSKWADADKYGGLEISHDGTEIRYVATLKSQEQEAAAARTDHPIPIQCGIYYYEVSLMSKGKEGMAAIGFSGSKSSLERLPGWEPESWAYHGDDGKVFSCHDSGKAFGPTFTVGDVIGCGVNFKNKTGFFTKNGLFLGTAFKDLKDIRVFPSIGIRKAGLHVKVNFGQSPFMFDIDRTMRNEIRSVQSTRLKADLSKLSPPLKGPGLRRDIVAQFLRHDGYIAAAKSFSEEVRKESALIQKDSPPQNESFNTQSDTDAQHRQQIRTAILDGDINRALKLTEAYYPHVLPDNPRILFRLRCRKFIELMRFSSTPAPTRKPSSKSLNTKTPSSTVTDDVFAQAMELDDTNGSADDWDRMETEELDGRLNGFSDRIEQALSYAQELRQDYNNKSKEVEDTLLEIFSLFAYADPRDSPTAHLLDPRERVPVAEELNAAILVSLGKSSSAAIERISQQTEALVSEITDYAGAGAFVNVIGDLLR